jgi:hypothetical protein
MGTENPILFAKQMGAKCPLAVASEELKLKFGSIEAPIQFEARAALCESIFASVKQYLKEDDEGSTSSTIRPTEQVSPEWIG